MYDKSDSKLESFKKNHTQHINIQFVAVWLATGGILSSRTPYIIF